MEASSVRILKQPSTSSINQTLLFPRRSVNSWLRQIFKPPSMIVHRTSTSKHPTNNNSSGSMLIRPFIIKLKSSDSLSYLTLVLHSILSIIKWVRYWLSQRANLLTWFQRMTRLLCPRCITHQGLLYPQRTAICFSYNTITMLNRKAAIFRQMGIAEWRLR